ncbi:MAG TPA: YndJ family transporter [Candidatus Angelobacter sp.]|nr:YndJ family transporter [Candidatus Angelobacter sp.]
MATVGALVWVSLVVGVFFGVFRLSIFDLLFLLAPWAVVPLALSFVPVRRVTGIDRVACLVVRYLLFPGAVLSTVSFFLRGGRAAAALVCLWVILAATIALDGLGRIIRTRLKSFQQFCYAIGEGYALVGALWLLASRLGRQPFGFHEPIGLLTAIHFHYAGLMAAILAGLAASETGTKPPLAILRIALTCAVLGPGVLGLAFLAGPKMKLAAVGLMLIGETGIALGTFRIGLTDARNAGGRMLLIGSACVIFGMTLAGIWAIGEYPLHAFVNLEQMARFHGVLNSAGFGLCSLVGWTLFRGKPQAPQV